jgi:hypothetical protein
MLRSWVCRGGADTGADEPTELTQRAALMSLPLAQARVRRAADIGAREIIAGANSQHDSDRQKI